MLPRMPSGHVVRAGIAFAIAHVLAACSVEAAPVSFIAARPVKASGAVLEFHRIVEVEDVQKAARAKPDDERVIDWTAPLPRVELEPGHWSVSVVSPEIWHQPQYFS